MGTVLSRLGQETKLGWPSGFWSLPGRGGRSHTLSCHVCCSGATPVADSWPWTSPAPRRGAVVTLQAFLSLTPGNEPSTHYFPGEFLESRRFSVRTRLLGRGQQADREHWAALQGSAGSLSRARGEGGRPLAPCQGHWEFGK